MDNLINEKINQQIEKLCLDICFTFQVDDKKLFEIWTKKEKFTENNCKYHDKYECNIIQIENISFLICSEGIFGKLKEEEEEDDITLITDKDENLCFKYGYKIMKGLIDDKNKDINILN
jgi:hypothetical protein